MNTEEPILNPTDEVSNSQKITQDHGTFESAAIVERAPAPVEEIDTDFISLIDMASDAAWLDMEDVFASPEDEGAAIDATSPEWQEQIPNWLDEDQLSAVMDAKTDTHFQSMLGQFHEDRQLQQDLTAYGMAGTAAQMFYTIADPVTLPLIVGTEAMAAPWIVAQKAGRVASLGQKIFRAGTIAGATEIAIATARSKAEADYTLQDAMMDVALVTGLSAPFGAFMKGDVDDALYEAAGQSSNRALLDAADAIETDMVDDIVHDMGAAEARYDRDKSGAHRFDDFNRAFRSANRGLKDLATKILSDPVGGTNKSAAAESDRWRSHFNGRLVRSAHDNFKAWAKAGGERFVGLSPVREARLKAQFSEELYKAVALGRHTDENVMKAAGEIRRINKDILKRAKQAGVKGFEEIDADANYIARYWDADKFRRQVNTHGTAKISRLIFKGLKSKAGDGADEEHLFKIALGMTHRMKNRSLSETTALHEMLDDAEELKKLLDDLGTSGDAEIEELVTQAKKYRKPAQRDVIARAKSRLDLDLSIEEDGLSFFELLNTDAVGVTARYNSNMSGWTALANKAGIKSPSDWNSYAKGVKQDAASAKDAEKDFETVERWKRELLGERVWDFNDDADKLVRTIGNMNFTNAMGKAFFAAFTEMGRVYAQNGMVATMKHVPEIKNLFKYMMKPSREADGLAGEINAFNAAIGDEMLMGLWGRLDEQAVLQGLEQTRWLDKAEITSHKLATTMANHIAPIASVDRTLRQFAFSSSITSLHRHLIKGKKLNWDAEDLGLDATTMQSIKQNMAKYAETGTFGEVSKLNIDKWEPGVAEDMTAALTRLNTQQVQRTLLGESVQHFQHPAGRMLLQFRSFMINSYTKHLVRDLSQLRDGRVTPVTMAWAGAAIMSGLQYSARTYTETVGMGEHERKRHLAERLDYTASPFDRPQGAFWANVVGYMPAMGAPVTAYNSVAGSGWGSMVGMEQLQLHRATGLKSHILGNPYVESYQRGEELLMNPEEATAKDLSYFVPYRNTILGLAAQNYFMKN